MASGEGVPDALFMRSAREGTMKNDTTVPLFA
jgi:hypothetical protein